MENNIVIDIIIVFVKALKSNAVIFNDNYKQYKIHSPKYLLNQILRQYEIADDHYLLSKKAEQLWEKITNEDIKNYHYRNTVFCENDEPIKVKIFKNNSNIFEEKILNKKDKFVYNDIFHNEHIIPIEIIIEQLTLLENQNKLNYENVKNVLDSIYVCRMLKEEDRRIKYKYKRPFNLNYILDNIYKEAGIEIF